MKNAPAASRYLASSSSVAATPCSNKGKFRPDVSEVYVTANYAKLTEDQLCEPDPARRFLRVSKSPSSRPTRIGRLAQPRK
jgi:hypothetical protein